MNKKEKRSFWGYNPFDYRVSEKIFNGEAEKGWMVKEVTPYIVTYEACKPCKKNIRVFIYDKNDVGDKAVAKYIEQKKKEGFHHICDYDRYHWFYTDGSAEEASGNTGEEYLTTSAAWRKEFYCLLLVLLAVAFGAIKLYNLSYISFITYSEFAKLMLLPVFAPICIGISIYFGIWMHIKKKGIRSGKTLQAPSLRAAKLRRMLVFVPVILFFALLILALILDACTGYAKTVLMISPILLVLCVVYIVRALKKLGIAAILGRAVIIIAAIVCVGVYAFGNFRNFSSGLPDSVDKASLASLGSGVEAEKTSYVHTASPAVSLHFIYKETAQNGAAANTEYFDCRNVWFADRIYEQIEKALVDSQDEYSLTKDGKIIIYKEVKNK